MKPSSWGYLTGKMANNMAEQSFADCIWIPTWLSLYFFVPNRYPRTQAELWMKDPQKQLLPGHYITFERQPGPYHFIVAPSFSDEKGEPSFKRFLSSFLSTEIYKCLLVRMHFLTEPRMCDSTIQGCACSMFFISTNGFTDR